MIGNHAIRNSVKQALALSALAALAAGSFPALAQQAATSKQTAASMAAAAQPTSSVPAASETLQTIVVTGSLISQTSAVTPSPVQIIGKQQILQSGYTNISQVLRHISANGASTLTQSFSFAFAAGAAGISLRGLSVGDTLVLIDGERTVPYPLLDDNERNFVDLSAIPFTAVRQVQVLKDGGSALYGSDAIAGVVNVILRKQYQGFQATAETGTSSHWDGTTEHLGFIGGEGDLATDGYNWYISGDFRHQDQVLAKNRSGIWDTLDFAPWGGYNNYVGNGTGMNPNILFPESVTGYILDPNNPTNLADAAFLPGCSYTALTLNRCSAMSPSAQLRPAGTAIDLLGKFTKEIGHGWELTVQASWFDSKSAQVSQYTNQLSSAWNGNGGQTVAVAFGPHTPPRVIEYPVITVPANYPGNPFGVAAPLVYNFPELGVGVVETNTNTYRLLATLAGRAAGWHIKATVGAMYARMDFSFADLLDPVAMQQALNNGYLLGSRNETALFSPKQRATPTSNMDLVDIHGTHKLFQMPGGPMVLAVGVQWNKEGHNVLPPPGVASGAIIGTTPTFAVGTEYDRAVFAELQGNPIKQIELNAEARYDNYKGFGSDTTPKLGIKFTPWRWIALRATWSKGFRVPTIAEGVSSGELFGAGSAFSDPTLCPTQVPTGMLLGPGDYQGTCNFPATGLLISNTHLKNVTSTNWTTGLILQPMPQLSASVDYYNIKISNDIVPAFEAGGLGAGVISFVRGNPVTLNYCPTTFTSGCTAAQVVPAQTPVGEIIYQAFPYVNANSTQVSGYDVSLRYHWRWGRIGRFSGGVTWTHEISYKLTVPGAGAYQLAGTHGPSGVSGDTGNPKDRIDARLSWSRGRLTLTPSVDFIGHFNITDPSSGIPDCGSALTYAGFFPGGVTPMNQQFCNVNYFLETNLYASYQVNGSWQVHASVTNLFNKQPPVDVQTYGSGSYFYPYDAAMHEDGAVGRFMTIGFTYDMD